MIKNINKKSKFKNTKLYKSIIIGSSIIIIASSITGCSPNETIVEGMISNDKSFEELLGSISDKTNIDEILNEENYINLLNEYKNYRKEKDLNGITKSLKNLGNTLVNASIADTLINSGVIKSYSDLIDVNIEYSPIINEFGVKEKDQFIANITYTNSENKIVNGNIEVTNDYINKKYLLEGKLLDLVYNLNNLDSEKINLDYTDEIFKSLETYLFTTGDINKESIWHSINNYDGTINNTYDYEKVKMLK